MIHVTKTQKWDFDMPKSCFGCPMHDTVRDGGCTLDFCELIKGCCYVVNVDKNKRDKKCPLVDGQTYII